MTSSKFSKPELRYVEKIDLKVKTLVINVSVRIVLWHCSIRFRIWKSKNRVETISPVTPCFITVGRPAHCQRYALTPSWLVLTSPISLGRPSLLLRDDHRATNGGDAVIDLGGDGTFSSSMKQQLQVIDETVGLMFTIRWSSPDDHS